MTPATQKRAHISLRLRLLERVREASKQAQTQLTIIKKTSQITIATGGDFDDDDAVAHELRPH